MNIKLFIWSIVTLVTSLSVAQVTLRHGVQTHQNKRPYQEDRFTHAITPEGEFFGIYDGHGGKKTSSYLKSKLHEYFSKYLAHTNNEKEAFEYAFLKAERYALDNFNDGSTAVAVYADNNNNMLHIAWAGDSRAVLECNGQIGFATKDHKPEEKNEKNRIHNAGGRIYHQGVWRVNHLAIARSIGDKICKAMGPGQIIAHPHMIK